MSAEKQAVPLNVLVDALAALRAVKALPFNPDIPGPVLMAVSYACGSLGYHVEEITKAQSVEVTQ